MALLSRNTPIEVKISALREEIDAFLDAKVEEIKKECVGVPAQVIRNTLTRGHCQCAVFLEMKSKGTA
jgi:hypothetical protein